MLNNKKKVIGLIVIVIAIVGFGLFIQFSSPEFAAKETVSKALDFIKNQNRYDGEVGLFSIDYLSALGSSKYYKVEEWELSAYPTDKENRYKVIVDGETENAFGATLDRNPIFFLEKSNNFWKIVDSDNFIAFDGIAESLSLENTDLETYNKLQEIKDDIIIEDWSFRDASYGSGVEGTALVKNNSDIGVNYVKLEIQYGNSQDTPVNSDWTYVVGSETLPPGGAKQVEWFTFNCNNCDKAGVSLSFD